MTMRLLVSVRNVEEVRIAIAGGVDILDVKEPAQGTLGYAGPQVVSDVLAVAAGRCLTSAAFGEFTDWSRSGDVSTQPVPQISGLAYGKCGPAGLLNESDSDWRSVAGVTREQITSRLAINEMRWVAVAYADAARANAPDSADILEEAIDAGCHVLLIDTWLKDDTSAFDWLSVQKLTALRDRAKAAGLLFALAGQVSLRHLSVLRRVAPDIVGVRGSVCEGGRDRKLSEAKVREFREQLRL